MALRTAPFWGAGLVLVLLVAGCLGKPSSEQADPGRALDAQPPTAKLALLAEPRVLVSVPGHRMSEFVTARDPADPSHLVVGAVDYDDQDNPTACATFWTRDGGRTWHAGGAVPSHAPERLRLDTWVTIDAGGRAHELCMEDPKLLVEHPNAALFHSESEDGGATWGPLTRVPGRTERHTVDKPAMHASSAGSIFICVVNADWDDVERTGDINLVVIESRDRGKTWGSPLPIKPGLFVCNGILEDASGLLHLNWFSLGGGPYPVGMATSIDGGATWTDTPIAQVPLPPDWGHGRWVGSYPGFSAPSAALNPTAGTIVVAAQSWNTSVERWEIVLYRSRDAGHSFERLGPAPVASATCPRCHAYHPALAFDAAGRLGMQVVFAAQGGLSKEFWFFVSPDEGGRWLDPVLLSRTGLTESFLSASTWAPRSGPAAALATHVATHPTDAHMALYSWAFAGVVASVHHRWGGDYWGIEASSEGFVAMWNDHSQNGVPQLWSSIVKVQGGGPSAAKAAGNP